MKLLLSADLFAQTCLLIGFFLDLVLGDPEWIYHPVRLVGSGITFLDKQLRKIFPKSPKGESIAGILLAILIPTATMLAVVGMSELAIWLSITVRLIFDVVAIWLLLSVRSLRVESMRVYTALQNDDLPAGRWAVSRIVGRDTTQLGKEQIIRATVETIAENTSDGIVAPLFYTALGGAALGWFYKAVNTLDSMVGYKNERYLYMGRASARFDDLLGYIPARLGALLMIVAAYLTGFDGAGAMRIWRRDRRNHLSPNSAQTESVCAGALGIMLAGDAVYSGKIVSKPTIGDNLLQPELADIPRANRLMTVCAVLTLVVLLSGKWIIYLVLWR